MADAVQRVKNDLARNQTVIFVGTRVSVYTTNGDQEFSYWKEFLRHGLQRCHQSGYLSDTDLEYCNKKFDSNAVEIDDCLGAANQIKLCFQDKEEAYQTWLMETIGTLSAKKPELIEAIGELGCPILTSNYDSLFENILNRKPLIWNQYQHTDHTLVNLNNSILHTYGYFAESDSVVFSNDDYEKIHHDEVVASKLKVILDNKTLLFIEYGAHTSDLHFSNLLKWIHYVMDDRTFSIYKVVQSNKDKKLNSSSDVSFLENIIEIPFGNTPEDF